VSGAQGLPRLGETAGRSGARGDSDAGAYHTDNSLLPVEIEPAGASLPIGEKSPLLEMVIGVKTRELNADHVAGGGAGEVDCAFELEGHDIRVRCGYESEARLVMGGTVMRGQQIVALQSLPPSLILRPCSSIDTTFESNEVDSRSCFLVLHCCGSFVDQEHNFVLFWREFAPVTRFSRGSER